MPSISASAELFSQDYCSARERFRAAANAAKWQLESHTLGGVGPEGATLTLDVATRSAPPGSPTLVISSGIHGVEGFFGSAALLTFLEFSEVHPELFMNIRCVLLNTLNPFGFAWLRRANEQNVDLNRNLLLGNEAYQGSPEGYANLDALLNPQSPPTRFEPVLLKFAATIARHGMSELKTAIASGQYEFPQGLFFGGKESSPLKDLLIHKFEGWLGDSTRVFHLDLHTGLGKSADYKLLIDYALTDAQRTRLTDCFGGNSFEVSGSNEVAYPTRGSFGKWLTARYPERDYLYACAEFGTYPSTQVLAGLRAENRAHHWGKADDPSTVRAKQRLMELFAPHSNTWRARVLATSVELFRSAQMYACSP